MAESSFGVEALAGEVGLSRRQLQRRLQALMELSPSGYLRMVRLERAAQLLEQQAGQVQEVARQVGFGSVEHFSRLFHQVFGVPPSQYPEENDPDISPRR
jgi:transcriptional regulator GlxA family with amidase domain